MEVVMTRSLVLTPRVAASVAISAFDERVLLSTAAASAPVPNRAKEIVAVVDVTAGDQTVGVEPRAAPSAVTSAVTSTGGETVVSSSALAVGVMLISNVIEYPDVCSRRVLRGPPSAARRGPSSAAAASLSALPCSSVPSSRPPLVALHRPPARENTLDAHEDIGDEEGSSPGGTACPGEWSGEWPILGAGTGGRPSE